MDEKDVAWLHGEVKSPPFSKEAQDEAGRLIRQLQWGIKLSMPKSRPMPSIGPRCHELRIQDEDQTWRIMYRIDEDSILVVEVFSKKTNATPLTVIQNCKRRLAQHDAIVG